LPENRVVVPFGRRKPEIRRSLKLIQGRKNPSMINYLALSGVLVSFCGTFVTAIPIMWYQRLKTVKAVALTASGEHVFGDTLDIEDLNESLERQKDYMVAGIVILLMGVIFACVGLFW
jgi:hypothetical protein